ncbi:MAG TPA: hypothetical protein VD884_10830 [Ohtaekwangia sp.]|nr:hypothetical protein [Ohtaekwangia sp.]
MDYYQGYDDGMYQARASRSIGLVGFLFRLFLSIVWGAFVYVPLLMLGYWIASKMSHLYSNEMFIKIPLTLLFAYLGFGLIYFLKGVLISLRAARKGRWILIWVVCVAATCGFQFFFVQYNLEEFLRNRNVANFTMWSWLGSIVVSILIYGHYKFLTNIAPGSVFPFFNAGFRMMAKRSRGAEVSDLPGKSAAYFENAEMKVSYRRD